MRVPDLTIGQRLALGFGLPLCLLAGVLWVVSSANVRQQEQHQALIEGVVAVAEATQELERKLFRIAIVTRDYLLQPDTRRLAAAESAASDARNALTELEQKSNPLDSRSPSPRLRALVEEYLQGTSALLSARPAGQVERLQEMAKEREIAVRQLDAVRSVQKAQFVENFSDMQRAREKLTAQLLAALFLSFALIALAGIALANSLRTPLAELLAGAAAIENGDWSIAKPWSEALTTRVRDEVHRLKRALGAAAVALERRDRRLNADRRIADAAATSLDADHIAHHALAAIIEKLHAGLGVIYFAEPGATLLRPVATYAAGSSTSPIAFGEGLAGQAAAERRQQVLRNVPRDTPFRIRLGYDDAPPRCVVAAPILFRKSVLGVVVVGAFHEFDDYSLGFLDSAAAQLAAGLQNAIAHAELWKLADQQRKQHEQIQGQADQLRKQNEELQAQGEEIQTQSEEIQVQNEELRTLTDELTLADTRKDEFIALVAHELRSPLAAISNSLEVLGVDDAAREDAASPQMVIARQTRQLNRLVEDLLDTTRIVRGSLEVQHNELDVVGLVRDCLDDLRPAVEEAGMKLEASLPRENARVAGDRERLHQVTSNLVSNAIKFRRPSGTVRVAVEPGVLDVTLRVTDDGSGIDPAFMPRLFEPFAQAKPSFEANAGLGLGLSLVKALVEAHKGSVTARSDGAGRGAEFVVRLPRA